jgi:hypothetical protein
MSALFEVGSLAVPEVWDVKLEITLREPDGDRLMAPLSAKAGASPRANIKLRRSRSAEDATQARAAFVAEARRIPQMCVVVEDTVAFLDGAVGAAVTICLPATPQLRVAQRHLFRSDDGVLTQLAATVEEHRLRDLEGSLQEIMVSYSPSRG